MASSGLLLAPAHRGPLGLLLGLLDQGEEPRAALLQVLVHQDTVEQVAVLDFQQLGRLLQLQEVVLLQEEKMQLKYVFPALLSNRLFSTFFFILGFSFLVGWVILTIRKIRCGTKGFSVMAGVRGQGASTVKALLAWALMIRASLLVSRSLSGLGGLMKITNGFSLDVRSI